MLNNIIENSNEKLVCALNWERDAGETEGKWIGRNI